MDVEEQLRCKVCEHVLSTFEGSMKTRVFGTVAFDSHGQMQVTDTYVDEKETHVKKVTSYMCPNCGTQITRDYNIARQILIENNRRI